MNKFLLPPTSALFNTRAWPKQKHTNRILNNIFYFKSIFNYVTNLQSKIKFISKIYNIDMYRD